MKKIRGLSAHAVLAFAILSCSSCDSCSNSGPEWQPLGPWNVQQWRNYVAVGGRVDDIQIAYNYDGKGNPAMFLATPGGGVWRSTDFPGGSPTWIPLTEHIPNISAERRIDINNIASISIDPGNPKNIWATAGGSPPALLHSSDGGDNWSLVGQGQFIGGTLARVLVDPAGFIWVASNSAFYVSENKGGSFTRIDSGDLNGKRFDDVVWYSPQKGRFDVYAGIIDGNKTNNQSGIWTVWGANGNFNWRKTDLNLQNIYGLAIANTLINTIRLYADQNGAVASVAQAADLMCPDPTGSIWGLLNVFQLDGNTWQPKWKLAPNTVGNEVQGGYVQPICIAPDGRIYAGGKGLAVSDGNGGVLPVGGTKATLRNCQITNENPIPDKNGKIYHVDVHAVRYCSVDQKMYIATDGGMVRFTPNFGIPGVVDFWEPLNTPSLTNFLSESVGASISNAYNVVVGHQDNGVIHLANSQWTYVGGGESDFVYYDPFGTGYFIDCSGPCGDPAVSTDGGNSFPQSVQIPDPDNSSLVAFHPTQKDRMIIPTHDNNRMVGKFTVYETSDGWKNPANARNLNPPIKAYPTAMSYAGDNIYVCDNQDIYLSTNDGGKWSNIWKAPGMIASILPDPTNANAVYLATQSGPGRVYFNPNPINNPTDFREITGNLPSAVKKLVLYSKGAGKDPLLYVATPQGVYRATAVKGMNTNWSLFGARLPDASIRDLQINPKSHWLYAATYGRGVWYTIDVDQL